MYHYVIAVAIVVRLVSGTPRNLSEGRIIGGKPAHIEDYPYQLSFEFNGDPVCGAILIKPNVAVTAAHCTNRLKKHLPHLTVRAGSSVTSTGGQVSGVRCICQHPRYDTDTDDYDISLLFLYKSLKLGTGVQTIPLQPVNREIRTGRMGTVTGWGLTRSGFPRRLRVVEVPKVDHSECSKQYGRYNFKVTKRMTCFGFREGGRDACQGDSGGPLVVSGKLVGVVSWGYKCAHPYAPGVYTKISDPEIRSFTNVCLEEFQNL